MERRDFLALAAAASGTQFDLQASSSAREISAGPLSLVFEPELGFVRFVRWGETEILRGIYAAVRDEAWNTIAPQIGNLRIEQAADRFRIEFDVTCRERTIDFFWRGKIEGQSNGSLRFDFKGEARSSFRKNRIGFCVLHPMEVAGKPFEAEDPSGKRLAGHFPTAISPHQPIKNLRAITHGSGGDRFEVRFAGDVFEMEDHRNWTDGNFKTYCTPLELPWPAAVASGARIEQTVTVTRVNTATPIPGPRSASASSTVTCEVKGNGVKLPSLGVGLGAGSVKFHAGWKPAHVRVDIKQPADWQRAAALGIPVEAALFLDPNELKAPHPKVARWLAFDQAAKFRPVLDKLSPGAPVGGGTNEYFTELNRGRPKTSEIDFASYSINPQVHAFDNTSLVENLAPQADTVWSAKQFLGPKPVIVSPVTLRPRFNPQSKDRAPLPPDPRQSTLFAAAWTLGSLKYLAESGTASATYYETHGPGGVLDANGNPYPLFHVLAAVAEFAGGECLITTTSNRFRGVALVLRRWSRQRVLVANLSPDPTLVRLPSVDSGTRPYRVRTLGDAGLSLEETRITRHTATQGLEVALNGYGVAIVDLA